MAVADGVGFEPTKTLPPCRFSRPVPSTTRPPIHSARKSERVSIRAHLVRQFNPAINRCQATTR